MYCNDNIITQCKPLQNIIKIHPRLIEFCCPQTNRDSEGKNLTQQNMLVFIVHQSYKLSILHKCNLHYLMHRTHFTIIITSLHLLSYFFIQESYLHILSSGRDTEQEWLLLSHPQYLQETNKHSHIHLLTSTYILLL